MKLHVTVVCGQIIFWLLLLFTFIIRLKARLQPNIRLTLWRVLAVWSYPQRSYIIQISSKSVHRFLIPRGVEIFPITLAIGFYNSLYYRTTVIEKKAIKDSRLHPRGRVTTADWWHHPLAPLCQNIISSAKLEVHNVLHCCQSRTEPRPQVTRMKNILKFGQVVFEICEQTHMQTNIHTVTPIAILRTHHKDEVIISSCHNTPAITYFQFLFNQTSVCC